MSLVCPYNEAVLDPVIVSNAKAAHCRCLTQGQGRRGPESANPLDLCF